MAMSDALVTPAWRDGHVELGAVARAARSLSSGGVVGLPTETVYGLAAVARDRAAVARVFTIKGRPSDHPVIVHVAGAEDLRVWGAGVADYAVRLAEGLWPGPLTLVVPAADDVPRSLTGGQDTVGLRCPAHPVALAVIDAAGPVAAPSANRFGQVSPTNAGDVVADIGDRLDPARDLVLDGGACPVGVEATILDCPGAAPRHTSTLVRKSPQSGRSTPCRPSRAATPRASSRPLAVVPSTRSSSVASIRSTWASPTPRRSSASPSS